MINLPNSWPELLQPTIGMVGRTRAEQLLILGVVAAPCILALLSRSVIAFGVAALLLGSSITAFQARLDVLQQWSIALAAFAIGCLTCLQAIRLRSSQSRIRRAEAKHVELEAVREQLEREVYWRTARQVASSGCLCPGASHFSSTGCARSRMSLRMTAPP
jgi:type IV secretory pathway TrbD component